MNQANRSIVAITVVFILAVTCGCATRPVVYQHWGEQIDAAPKNHQTKDDISRILDHEPAECETIPGKPTIGILLRHNSGTTVLDVFPNSPAAGTGIQVGDKILSVNSKPVHSMEDVIASTEDMDDLYAPISIETQRGTYVVTPNIGFESEQCTWEVKVNRAAHMLDSPTPGDEALPQIFLASCRFTDGKAYLCKWRWRE